MRAEKRGEKITGGGEVPSLDRGRGRGENGVMFGFRPHFPPRPRYCDGTAWRDVPLNACNAGTMGLVKQNGSSQSYCDGTNWIAISP